MSSIEELPKLAPRKPKRCEQVLAIKISQARSAVVNILRLGMAALCPNT
jgi:hypothetical protein